MSMDDAGEMRKQSFGDREPNWDEKIKWLQIPDDGEHHAYRFIARPVYYAQHWISTRKKDGTPGKAFPAMCKNYDSSHGRWAENGCKVCEFMDLAFKALYASEKGKPQQKDANGKPLRPQLPDQIKRMNRRITMATNAIIRELQQQGAPQNNSNNWTFVHPVRLPQGVADKIVDLQAKFGAKNPGGGTFGFNHKDNGKDIYISYSSQEKNPNEMYKVLIGPNDPTTPLKPEEMSQQPHLVNFIEHLKYPKDEVIEEALRKNGHYEWLEKMNAVANLKQIERSSSPTLGAFDDGGGLGHAGESRRAAETPSIPNDGPIGNFPAPKVEDDLPVDLSAYKGTAKDQVAPEPKPTPAPVAQAPVQAPVQAPQASPKASTGSDIDSKIRGFCTEYSKQLVVHDKAYADLKFFRQGMSVPECFTKYDSTPPCKKCPLRLDCMMTTAE